MKNKIYKMYDFMRALLVLIGYNVKLNTKDRKILEEFILPRLEDKNENKTILNVGANWYTESYSLIFEKNRYIELEIDWWRFQFCTSETKIKANLLNLPPSFTFNYIILNGVFGYGINTTKETEQAARVCDTLLAKGGTIIIGGNPDKNLKPPLQVFLSLGFEADTYLFEEEIPRTCPKYKFFVLSKKSQ